MSNAKRELVHIAAWLLGVKIAGAALALTSQVFLARLLGLTQFGIYSYVLTWLNLLILVGKLGLDVSAQRFFSSYSSKAELSLLASFFSFGKRSIAWCAGLIALVSAVALLFARRELGDMLTMTGWIACLTLPIAAEGLFAGGCLQGLGRIIFSRVTIELARPIILCVALILFILSGHEASAHHAMGINLAAQAGVSITLWIALRRYLNRYEKVRSTELSHQKDWLRSSLQLLFIAALQLIMNQTDIIMLGILQNTDQAGIYTVASRLATLLIFATTALNTAIAPRLAVLHASGDTNTFQQLVTLAARLSLGSTVFVTLGLYFLGNDVVELFGRSFLPATGPLLALAAGQIVNASVGPVGYILMMTGNQGIAVRVMLVAALLNVVLNAVLIPAFGGMGAAIATSITAAGWNIGLARAVNTKLNIRPFVV